MFYGFELNELPTVKKFYTVVRNTIWGITDSDHILIIVTDGKCSVSCDGEDYILDTGEAFFSCRSLL